MVGLFASVCCLGEVPSTFLPITGQLNVEKSCKREIRSVQITCDAYVLG